MSKIVWNLNSISCLYSIVGTVDIGAANNVKNNQGDSICTIFPDSDQSEPYMKLNKFGAKKRQTIKHRKACLLYTSDAADE